MSSNIVSVVYRSVINDVIDNVRKDFEDFGDSDGRILAKLRRTWELKIRSAKVATWEQNDVSVGEECGQNGNGNPSMLPFPQPPQNESIPKGLPGPDFDTPAANLPLLATQTIMSDNGVGRPQHFLSQTKNGNGISLPSTTANAADLGKYVMFDNSQTEALQAPQNNAFVGQPPSYPQTMEKKQEIDMHEQKVKENGSRATSEVVQNTPTPPPQQPGFDSANRESRLTDLYPEEDEINSDLDDSDDEGAAEGEEIQNIILCLYDKVTRTKNKWKCQLKDGVMSVNGKDFLFQKGNGDFEF